MNEAEYRRKSKNANYDDIIFHCKKGGKNKLIQEAAEADMNMSEFLRLCVNEWVGEEILTMNGKTSRKCKRKR